jgi:hypothetical protein
METGAISKSMVLLLIALISVTGAIGAYYSYRAGPQCQPEVQGFQLEIRVVQDSSEAPIQRATIEIIRTDYCGNQQGSIFATESHTFAGIVTPINGTASIVSPPVGQYLATVTYSGRNYNVQFTVAPLNITSVVLSIPSGVISITYIQPP